MATTAPSNAYPSMDGKWFLIGANSDSLFARLCKAMGRMELLSDPRFVDNPARVRHAVELDREIAAWTRSRPIAELEASMDEAGIPASRIYTIADIAADRQFQERGMIQKVADPRLGEVLHPGVVPAMEFDRKSAIRGAGPEVGEHNKEVFEDLLGMPEAEVARLLDAGVI